MKNAGLHSLLLVTIVFCAFLCGLFLGRLGPFQSNTLSGNAVTVAQQYQNLNSESTDGFVNGKLNINTATAEDFTLLPGIGDILAGRIIAYRESNGLFTTTEDLLNVKGIGSAVFTEIAEYITIGG